MNKLFGFHARRMRKAGLARRGPATRSLRFETLERRDLMAANLHAESISVTQGAIVGEQWSLTARFKSTDLDVGSRFNVQVLIDGQELQTQSRSSLAGIDQTYAVSVNWFARPGKIELRLDTGGAIAEADENDNVTTLNYTPADPNLPEKFVYPIFRRSAGDGFVLNYVDLNLQTGQPIDFLGGGPFAVDFQGGPFAYDTHTGVDYWLQELFPTMDAGIPVFAAASGTVTDVYDGFFDRQTNGRNVTELANYVGVNLGPGWDVFYTHLATNTVTVRTGDRIRAGQMLGLAGSSGTTRGPHLHFNVSHLGHTVETHLAAEKYWREPVLYSGDAPSSVFASGITNYTFSTDLGAAPAPTEIKEGPSETRVFPTTSAADVVYWARVTPVRFGDNVQVQWHRPDGTLAAHQDDTVSERLFFNTVAANWTLDHARWSQHVGTWHVAMVVNGREIDRQSFEVTTGPGVPEMRVTQGNTYIIDGRTTPIDFGSAGTTPRTLTFTIQNHGSVALTTNGLELPPGFSLVGALPASVAPGTSANFQVQLDTGAPGAKFGQVRLHTNDADEGDFNFNIKGFVSGPIQPGTPRITVTGPAIVYINSAEPRLFAATANVTDSDSTNFNTGQLKVEFASGGNNDDRLAIRNQGSVASEIGVAGNSVTFGGVSIGTFAGGQGETPLVIALNANATPAAVQALVRNLTFANVLRQPATNHRYVRLTLVDDTGKASNMAIAHVLVDPRPEPILGDLNGDGQVDADDLTVFARNFGRTTGAVPADGDIDGNGTVDADDLTVFANNFGKGIGSPLPAPVRQSEPSAAQAISSHSPVPLGAPALPTKALAVSLVDNVLVDSHARLSRLRTAMRDDLTTLLADGWLRNRITLLSHRVRE